MPFVVKTEVRDPNAETFALRAQKTMYGGKHICRGAAVFIFASENDGGDGLIARAVATFVEAVPRVPGIARQTPRVSVTLERTASSTRPLGRADLKAFKDWDDGRPETELNFQLYRQATNKIVGISDEAAAFLEAFFDRSEM